MTDLLALFDAYSRRARIYPALIVLAPLFVMVMMLVPWSSLNTSHAIAGLGLGVAFFMLEATARRMGKRLEGGLYKKWGGKPSVIVMRHNDPTFDAHSKARYHGFLARQIGGQAPTVADEGRDPNKADAFYESEGNWLRERARNRKDLSLIREDNIHYGFWRNLYGLKRTALVIDGMASLTSIALLALIYTQHLPDARWEIWATVLGVAIVHGLFMTMMVTERVVREAAFQYGRQLMLACEVMIGADRET